MDDLCMYSKPNCIIYWTYIVSPTLMSIILKSEEQKSTKCRNKLKLGFATFSTPPYQMKKTKRRKIDWDRPISFWLQFPSGRWSKRRPLGGRGRSPRRSFGCWSGPWKPARTPSAVLSVWIGRRRACGFRWRASVPRSSLFLYLQHQLYNLCVTISIPAASTNLYRLLLLTKRRIGCAGDVGDNPVASSH